MTMHLNGLTKLIEELGELTAICAKKSAYIDTDEHPDGKGSLKVRMEDEIADVMAAISFVSQQFDLDIEKIDYRGRNKVRLYYRWHDDPNS